MTQSLMDQIKQQMAQAQNSPGAQPTLTGAPVGFAPGAPPPAAVPHAPGYPQSAPAHVGAPVPTAGLPPVFPAAAPGTGAPAGVPGGPFNPAAFSFGGQAPQAQAPAQVVQAPPSPVAPSPPAFGAPSSSEGWLCDGQGGYFAAHDVPAMVAAGHPQAVALWGHLVAPAPTAGPPAFGPAAVAPSPTPGLPPEAFAPGGPVGAPAPSLAPPTGSPAPAVITQPEKRKRRTKAEMAADAAAAQAAGQAPPAGSDAELYAQEAANLAGFEPRDTTPAPADPMQALIDALDRNTAALNRLSGFAG